MQISPLSYRECSYVQATDAWCETGIEIPEKVIFGYITMYPNGRVETKPGFTWDGASGAVDTENMIRPSWIHDVGCRLEENGLIDKATRHKFDDLLETVLDHDTKPSRFPPLNWWNDFRSRYIHRAVYIYSEKKAGTGSSIRPIITVGK